MSSASRADDAVAFLARVISGNARLLLGVIRANRPWRLVARLSYLRLPWLVSSLATVGGVLGGALESNEAVREAAYAR